MSGEPWFIDVFWNAGNPTYGSRLDAVGITKEVVMTMKSQFYSDLNDLDFVVTLEAMKKGPLLRRAHAASGIEETRGPPLMGGSRRRKRKSRRKSKSKSRRTKRRRTKRRKIR